MGGEYYPRMIWLQGATCFLLWIAYGVVQTRRSQEIRIWASLMPKGKRVGLATAFMIGSIIVMFATLLGALQMKGFGPAGMTLMTWPIVGIVGLFFVHGQTMATALLLTTLQESVTARHSEPSTPADHSENPPR